MTPRTARQSELQRESQGGGGFSQNRRNPKGVALEPDEREWPILLLALNILVFFSGVEIGSPASQHALGRRLSAPAS
jgi:hypothetical protein